MNRNYDAYRDYVLQGAADEWDFEVNSSKRDLLNDMSLSTDFHPDTLRNGSPQPLILTRGGEQHTYNIVCRPGDDLYAGDLIDAFGHKWLVMEARADATTHKTGVMYQCNHLFRFQNFDSRIVEVWSYINQSGYSSQVTGTSQIQKAEEKKAGFSHNDFGDQLIQEFKIIEVNGVLYVYEDGYYQADDKIIENKMIELYPGILQRQRTEVLAYIRIKTHVRL